MVYHKAIKREINEFINRWHYTMHAGLMVNWACGSCKAIKQHKYGLQLYSWVPN